MKSIKWIATLLACAWLSLSTAWAAGDFNIKYSSNYLMPAYVHFKATGSQYAIDAKINVPLYNIAFKATGTESKERFNMLSYRDTRNGKTYAMAEIDSKNITYGKVKNNEIKTVLLDMPTYDLFTMAFQLSYFNKLPSSFQITNGKKLYPMPNVNVKKAVKNVSQNGKSVEEITYTFRTGNKDVMVKKFAGEKFPRFISYSRDGDNYELTFDSFVK